METIIRKPPISKEFTNAVKRAVTAEYENHPEWGERKKSIQVQVRDLLDLLTENVISEWLAMYESVINAKLEEVEKRAGNIEQMANRLTNCETLINHATSAASVKLRTAESRAEKCVDDFNAIIKNAEDRLASVKAEKEAVRGNEEYADVVGLYRELISMGLRAQATSDVAVREAAYITWAVLGGDNEAIATAKKHDDELTESEHDKKSFNPKRK